MAPRRRPRLCDPRRQTDSSRRLGNRMHDLWNLVSRRHAENREEQVARGGDSRAAPDDAGRNGETALRKSRRTAWNLRGNQTRKTRGRELRRARNEKKVRGPSFVIS